LSVLHQYTTKVGLHASVDESQQVSVVTELVLHKLSPSKSRLGMATEAWPKGVRLRVPSDD